jgi:hypothetical protein
MTSGVQLVGFEIRHVGYPGERVPITRMKRCEGPRKIFHREAAVNLSVVRHIDIVIEIDEVEGLNRPVQDQSGQR